MKRACMTLSFALLATVAAAADDLRKLRRVNIACS